MSDSKDLPTSLVPEGAIETVQFVQPADSSTVVTNLLPAGTRMGHYVVKKYIGGGGMGQVYRATDEALDRNVAIKVLTKQRANDQGNVARFLNEARSAARLNHEHIAQVYFAGEASGVPFIAFEYVEGTNVRTMVEEHDVFPLPQALNYLLQIAHALAHATTHGVVHRDVKPSNILITREGCAKLIDMGLARLLDTTDAKGDLTASGVTLGTFDYISPEQARDPRNADIRSDIYSLGCTLFYMLAGRPPFPEGTVLQKLLQHQGDAPPDIRAFQPTIPAEIAYLIQKMMAKDPKQRFQTPTVLIEALTEVARRLGLRPASQGSLVWTPVRPNRASLLLSHVPWIAAVSLLLVGFFVATLFLNRAEPIHPPDITAQAPPAPPRDSDVVNPPIEPIRTFPPSFDVVFVSPSAVPSFQRLAASKSGGGLRPATGTGRLANTASGTFSVSEVSPATQRIAPGRQNPFSLVRVVDPSDNTIGSFPSIASALAGAEDGTTIQLKWNGVQRIIEPIRLDNRKLKFVAAPAFEPVLQFAPTELQRSFFTVFASDLAFEDVGIDVRIDPNVWLTFWSLFELSGNVRLTFDKCCLTIHNRTIYDNNAYHDNVVFFHNSVPTDSEGTHNPGDAVFDPLTLTVSNSLLRGEAFALRSSVSQDIRVEFTNALVALAKPFIHISENRRAERQTTIRIQWNQVAFFGSQGFALLQKEPTADPMVVDFDSQQSVFVLNRSPFAEFRGLPLQSRLRVLNEFLWSGEENYFQGTSGVQFRSPTLEEMSLEEWLEPWTYNTHEPMRINKLMLSEIVKPMSRYSPQDLRTAFGLLEIPLPEIVLPLRWYAD
ncbi:MAG: serine/threonine protein kinase [Planctomycetaceae bacterium]|nr:serine/threonine protein kinase [Planctomycetaceae bacterium]